MTRPPIQPEPEPPRLRLRLDDAADGAAGTRAQFGGSGTAWPQAGTDAGDRLARVRQRLVAQRVGSGAVAAGGARGAIGPAAAGGLPPARGRATATAREQRRAVATENILSRGLSADDARWILAARAGEQLQGGSVAALPAESRRGLMHAAHALGMRPFEAGLVIAVVQDAARRGETLESARPLLGFVPARGRRAGREGSPSLRVLVWALALGAALLAAMAAWVTR
ncbi:MAG: hypothetical protein C0513_00670 [Isosphaera sp.]|nr:hypothetical protein [Isosphaera sp.]